MTKLNTLSLTALLALSTGGSLFAQQGPKPKIAEARARATALAAVPGGKVQSEELENEHGHLIYSYDIEVAGRAGIEEINVDAYTGQVLAHEHEGPAAEKTEARKEGEHGARVEKSERGEKEGGEASEAGEAGEHGEAEDGGMQAPALR